jgi:diguanylate cyclase (GGDEF)-like protein
MLDEILSRVFATGDLPRSRRALIVGIAFAIMIVVAVVDLETGNSLEWSVAYAACVAVIAWYGGMAPGLTGAALTSILSLTSAFAAGGPAAPGETLAALPIGFVLALFAATLAFLHDALRRSNDLARTDALTGAANVRAFREAAESELERLRRYGDVFTLAFFDMDDFKQVNDRLGHAAGDDLLHMFVDTMRERTRGIDFVARVGGDEFVLLMPHTGADASKVVLGKVRGDVSTHMDEHRWNADVSAGAVTFEAAPDSVDEMLRMADAAMYDAKHAGKGHTEFRVFTGAPLARAAGPANAVAPAV